MISGEQSRYVKPNRIVKQTTKVIRRIGVMKQLTGHRGHAESPMNIVNVHISDHSEACHLTAALPHHVTNTVNRMAVF